MSTSSVRVRGVPNNSNNNIGSPAPAAPRTMSTPVTPPRPRMNMNMNTHSRRKKQHQQPSWNHHLSVDKKVVDELLLVCGVIGSTVDPDTGKMLPVEDCINWLQDLQRALRRDEDAYRPISLLLGQWKVVEQKLLPLVLSCRYNTPLLLTVVKILVILTKPLSRNAVKAGKLIINTKKTEELVIKEQIKLRDNAIAQANLLTEYKKLITHHPSHRPNKSKRKQSKQEQEEGGILSIFVSLLAEPLSRTGHARSTDDHHTIELILHLFRNLLCAGEPILKDVERTQSCAILHQQLIRLFEKEMVLDFLLVIGQEMESRENKQYNLLVMEILHHMLKNQDPTLVARSVIEDKSRDSHDQNKKTNSSDRFRRGSSSTRSVGVGGGGILSNQLKKERQRMMASSSSRHSHFGGTLVVKKSGGQQRYVSAKATPQMDAANSVNSTVAEKKKTKKHQYFIGGGRNHAIYTRDGVPTTNFSYTSGPTSHRVQQLLHHFCERFMSQCYGPVMKSLKQEFMRDSSRLESEDKVIFFRIIWFFCQWRRIAMKEGDMKRKTMHAQSDSEKTENGIDPSKSAAGQLIFTMDVFTFNMVLSSGDFFEEHKKHSSLAQSVALYVEMMHLLFAMYNSSDSTEQIMALGLMDRLFYRPEPIDRLPKLLSKWTPGTFTREYICDLIELTYVTTKLLECNAKACMKYRQDGVKKKKKVQGNMETMDSVTRMKTDAAYFDFDSYLGRKLISNQTVLIFTQLLSQYDINSTAINDHIVAFFVRLCKIVVASDDFDEEFYEQSARKVVTLEPMLFNLPMLNVVNDILNDASLRNNRINDPLLNFASTVVRHYARECEKNPMLHVETFFQHAHPRSFCERLGNHYIPDELKMIIERDTLLEQSRQEYEEEDFVEKTKQVTQNVHRHEEEEEEEMEFNDDGEIERKALSSSNDTDSKSGDEEDESAPPTNNNKKRTAPDDIIAIEKELDEDEERWNDRRSFVPKRKKLSLESGNSSDEEDDIFQSKGNEKTDNNLSKTSFRTMLEDSDDEDFGAPETQPRRLTQSAVSSQRQFLDDSDDDD